MNLIKENNLEKSHFMKSIVFNDITTKKQYDDRIISFLRKYCVLSLTMQIIFQIRNMIKPQEGSRQFEINVLYCGYLFVIVLLLMISIKSKYQTAIVQLAYSLLYYKVIFRQFDFENTKTTMEDSAWRHLFMNNESGAKIGLSIIIIFLHDQWLTLLYYIIFVAL